MDKKQLKADLIAHLRGGIAADEAQQEALDEAAQADEQDVTRTDEIVHMDEAGAMVDLIEEVEDRQSDEADAVEALDFSATKVVRPGAVIELDGAHYVVGVSTSAFTSGGVEYTGISTDAPMYAVIEGKKAGDTVTFANAEHHLDAVG